MADYRRLRAFRELVDVVEADFADRGMPLKPGAARELVAERADRIAGQMGITPRSALEYLSADALRALVRNTARQVKEVEAAEDARPPVSMSYSQAGLVISAFSVSARLGVVNGDPDVAADLCEVITRLGLELRGERAVRMPALLLSRGLRWAGFCAENLASGKWSAFPGKAGPDDDQRVAVRLHEDLEDIERLLDVRGIR